MTVFFFFFFFSQSANTRGIIANEHVTEESLPDLPPLSLELPTSNGLEDSAMDEDQIEETVVELPPSMDTIAEEPSGDDSTSNDGSDHNQAESTPSGNIALQVMLSLV